MGILGLMLSCDPRFRQNLTEELRANSKGNLSISAVGPGVILVDRLEGNDMLWADLLNKTPFFLRHIFPVLSTGSIDSAKAVALAAARVLPSSLEGGKVGVQCRIIRDDLAYRAIDVKMILDAVILERGGVPETKLPENIVSIVVGEKAYVGYSTPQQNLTRWNGGAVHYGAAKNSFSRAQHKLEEALEVFNIDLASSKRAVDLGAAPGGWTALLLARGVEVTAVDTGDLHPDLLKQERLTYLRQNAFELRLPKNSVDLLTCDMSWDPLRTAQLVVDLKAMLRPKGKVIMTVKFMGKSPLGTVRECVEVLKHGYELKQGRHLWHNREELTLYLERM